MSDTDLQLLARYTQQNAEDAFTEIVHRHLDLVYSAALRQVRVPQLAEEVSQSAFIDLARNARTLAPDTVLAAWLYRVTCRTAIDVIRRESSRQAREQIATEINDMNVTAADWNSIEPLLDEAMDALDQTDRAAILLYYFENMSLREVGQTLGASEDAAQKRVSRAVDRLCAFFSKRDVTVSAGGLIAALTANAVEAAPLALAATVSSAAALTATTITATSTAATVQTITMTTLQKTLIASTLTAAIATGVYENRQASHLRDEVRSLEIHQANEIRQLQQERDEATERLAAFSGEYDRLRRDNSELPQLRGEVSRRRLDSKELSRLKTAESAAATWAGRAQALKERVELDPDAAIPEFQFLTEEDWLAAARKDLDSETDTRRAFSKLRAAGESRFVSMLTKALKNYSDDNQKQSPTDLKQLQPYFDTPVDEAILERWMIAPPETVPNVGMGGDVIITQKAAVDEMFDTRYVVGPSGGVGSTGFQPPMPSQTKEVLQNLYKEFMDANNGKEPNDPSQMLPYVTTPEQRTALQDVIRTKALLEN